MLVVGMFDRGNRLMIVSLLSSSDRSVGTVKGDPWVQYRVLYRLILNLKKIISHESTNTFWTMLGYCVCTVKYVQVHSFSKRTS